jgi:hypothetical protein
MKASKRAPGRHNPVAKYSGKFNRAATFRDRSKYRRNSKHKGREPFPLLAVIGE